MFTIRVIRIVKNVLIFFLVKIGYIDGIFPLFLRIPKRYKDFLFPPKPHSGEITVLPNHPDGVKNVLGMGS